MAPRSVILAAAAALFAGGLLQAPATAEPYRVEAESARMTPLGLTVGQIKGTTLRGEAGEELGKIEEVLATRGGQVTALVVEIGDGVLGIGQRQVLLRFDQVRRSGHDVMTLLSRAQIGAQPPWND